MIASLNTATDVLRVFGLDATVSGVFAAVGIVIVIVTVLGTIWSLGFGGEQGKQKLKKKAPLAALAAILCFMPLFVMDVIVAKLQDTGDKVKNNGIDQILESSPASPSEPVIVTVV